MKEKIVKGSGNVFKDLGLEDADRLFTRSEIMIRIVKILKERRLTQRQAGKILNLPQSKVSALMNGRLNLFSMDYLLKMLNLLDRDVEIIIKPKSKSRKVATTSVFPVF